MKETGPVSVYSSFCTLPPFCVKFSWNIIHFTLLLNSPLILLSTAVVLHQAGYYSNRAHDYYYFFKNHIAIFLQKKQKNNQGGKQYNYIAVRDKKKWILEIN